LATGAVFCKRQRLFGDLVAVPVNGLFAMGLGSVL
jgi:hypothetical protein